MQNANKEYSGPYLWLATISLAMPVFVAVQAFQKLPDTPYTYREVTPDASGVDQLLWDDLVRAYVANGRVDYDGMKRDFRFREYIRQIAGADPENLETQDDQMAFYCNAYNALVIDGVNKHRIRDSVDGFKSEDGKGFFKIEEHIVAGETMSLDYIEQDIVRPVFNEPRIHMALVCAAKSCPSIRGEAFIGERIQEQLEDQATKFANNPDYVKFEKNTLYLNPILKWYKEDFGGLEGAYKFVQQRSTSDKVKAGIDKVLAGEADVKFNKYDWTLNTQGNASYGGGGDSHFGSGSIPNE